VDVLLVVDNSSSMADKQAALGTTVTDMMAELTAEGSGVEDVHVGVITSSLGGLGSQTCEPRTGATELRIEMEDDRAHLLGARPRAASAGITTDFATWSRGAPSAGFVEKVQALVTAAGEHGCGYESTLEAAYRFLADPEPPETVALAPCAGFPDAQCATRTGRDTELLAQRAAFLRPDSAVAIVVLSDENDCSTRDGGQFFFQRRQDITMGASSACARDPNDPCCHSCLQAPPEGCAADPACLQLDAALDPPNLRCFDQRRRFGIDFLQPIARYVNAFTMPWLCTSRDDLSMADCAEPMVTPGVELTSAAIAAYEPAYERNPLFQSEDGNRGRSMVYFLGIVGVPTREVSEDGTVNWARVLGDGDTRPANALMVESIYPRAGDASGTEVMQPPGAGYLANSENGHEHLSSQGEDLQHACIFPLAEPRDCADFDAPPALPGQPATAMDRPFCDCSQTVVLDQNPLCQAPDGGYSRIQRFGKAYPGLRHLAVTKEMGDNGAVGSICARNLTDPGASDYGYRASMQALLDRIRRSVD
jgi:hypothetical protein